MIECDLRGAERVVGVRRNRIAFLVHAAVGKLGQRIALGIGARLIEFAPQHLRLARRIVEPRLDKIPQIFDTIEEWTKTKKKLEVMAACNQLDIPCGPILSMKELAEEPSLRATGTFVEVDHPERGKSLTVGNPLKLSDSPADVKRSPPFGENTAAILRDV